MRIARGREKTELDLIRGLDESTSDGLLTQVLSLHSCICWQVSSIASFP